MVGEDGEPIPGGALCGGLPRPLLSLSLSEHGRGRGRGLPCSTAQRCCRGFLQVVDIIISGAGLPRSHAKLVDFSVEGGAEMEAGWEQGKAAGGGVDGDLYAVLGLKKECSAAELRSAYKKLALRWHPDRCSALGSSKSVEEAKAKFQAIQGAYSVLSDTSKRFLYDVGVYDSDDDYNGMGDFLGEMAAMMRPAKPNEAAKETFEELQELFVEMFQADMDAFCGLGGYGGGGGGNGGGPSGTSAASTAAAPSSRVHRSTDGDDRPSTSSASFCTTTTAASFYGGGRACGGAGHKRDSAEMCSGKAKAVAMSDGAASLGPGAFRFGVHDGNGSSTAPRGRAGSSCGGGKRKNGRKPKVSSRHGAPPSQGDGEICL